MTLALLNIRLDHNPQFGPQSFPLRPVDLDQPHPEHQQERQHGEAGPHQAGRGGEDGGEEEEVGESLGGHPEHQAGHHQRQEHVERRVVDLNPRHLHDVPLEAVPAVAVEDEEYFYEQEEGRTEEAEVEVSQVDVELPGTGGENEAD